MDLRKYENNNEITLEYCGEKYWRSTYSQLSSNLSHGTIMDGCLVWMILSMPPIPPAKVT